MYTTNYFMLSGIVFMALAAIVIFIINIARGRPKPMMSETGGIVPFLSLGGILGFLTGMGLVFYARGKFARLGFWFIGVGFFSVCASIVLNASRAKALRAAWPVISAHCAHRELRRVRLSDGEGLFWALNCEVSYAGKNYLVTPKVRWGDMTQAEKPFRDEKDANQFIAQVIPSSGQCKLRVNPTNPLEAELIS